MSVSLKYFTTFPAKSESTYFIIYLKNKEYVRPIGRKLFDRYCNLSKDIRKLNYSSSQLQVIPQYTRHYIQP